MIFHHIGIATEDISLMQEKLKKYFEIINISETVFDEKQNANLCMLTTKDNLNIELISGPVVENLVKKRQYLYHTCYSTDNIDEMIAKLVEDGALLISAAKPAILFDNQKVAFLMTDLGLIELLEEGN